MFRGHARSGKLKSSKRGQLMANFDILLYSLIICIIQFIYNLY